MGMLIQIKSEPVYTELFERGALIVPVILEAQTMIRVS